MKKYLVGGAVRNKLLNLPVQEKDWVIVGSDTQDMLNLGYTQVGKDFPVFLHPYNQEEYALARTERKFRPGHTGFVCYTSPTVTIEEDLARRDLTINSMAYDEYGNLIDPYHGKRDIQLRILRHISNSFCEDPLRVLRVARFAAYFAHLNFTVAPETLKLMIKMKHELLSLSPERVWVETKKALLTKNPQVYFQILRRCGALKVLFPELNTLFDIPYSITKKQKTSIGYDVMTKLSKIVLITNDLSIRFAILCHRLNKETINYQKYYGNNTLQLLSINNLIKRLRIPKKTHNLAKIVSKYYKYLSNIETLSSSTLITLFKVFDCWRQPERLEQIILIARSYITTPINHNNYIYIQEKFFRQAFIITQTITPNEIIKDGFTKSNIKKELLRRRLHILKKWKKSINY